MIEFLLAIIIAHLAVLVYQGSAGMQRKIRKIKNKFRR